MADVFAKHAAGMKSLQAYLGDGCPYFIWNGQTVSCQSTGEDGEHLLGEGGYRTTGQLKIRANVSDMLEGVLPGDKQTIEFFRRVGATAKQYRIKSVKVIFDTEFEMDCNDPNEGA